MTREQAIQTINNNYPSSSKGEYEDLRNALNMAIRSLEAWDKVMKEMEEKLHFYDGMHDAMPNILYGISESFDIIKKHMKEVEDEQIH